MPAPKTKTVRIVSLRLVREGNVRYPTTLSGPQAAAEVARQLIEDCDREKFVTMYLDRKNRVIAAEVIAVGTATCVIVSPAMVFRGALLSGAVAICLGHNHPSGSPEPSAEDYELTQTLIDCGRMLGVNVLDHIVIGERSHVSIREQRPSYGWGQ